MRLTVKQRAPAFTLLDQEGKKVSLASARSEWVLLYFYPKDATPGCTKEACAIAESFPALEKLNATVFGVSADSPKSHRAFAEKHKLPFRLLSDEKRDVIKRYGAWGVKKLYGREYEGIKRMSFLIDPRGVIAKIYPTVRPAEHGEEVLRDIAALSSKRSS